MSSAVVFDDGQGRLGPMTDLRSSFEVRTGAFTTFERLRHFLETVVGAEVRAVAAAAAPGLGPLATERLGLPHITASTLDLDRYGDDEAVFVNGRCVLPPDEIDELEPGTVLVEGATGGVIAARLEIDDARRFLDGYKAPERSVVVEYEEPCLIDYPWDVVSFRDLVLDHDMSILLKRATQPLPPGVIGINVERIIMHPEATIYPGVVLDAGDGPIVIDDDALIRPGAIIRGPAYIGPRSSVLDHALIKAHTAIGPACKVAGEIGGTIFQGYANKAHDGHLGDSWVGEWVNLGAGTTNSNLLNTYGEIVAAMPTGYTGAGERHRTGLQFLGAILGDHVKTAICTKLMTGSIIGTGAMLATTAAAPTNVAPFSWLTDERSQMYRLSKFIEVMQAVMARRKVEASAAYMARLSETHRAAVPEC